MTDAELRRKRRVLQELVSRRDELNACIDELMSEVDAANCERPRPAPVEAGGQVAAALEPECGEQAYIRGNLHVCKLPVGHEGFCDSVRGLPWPASKESRR
jgi:hypothetical protein